MTTLTVTRPFVVQSRVLQVCAVKTGLVRDLKKPVKVLGRGEIDVALVVEAHRFSRSAREKIEAAGGSVRIAD